MKIIASEVFMRVKAWYCLICLASLAQASEGTDSNVLTLNTNVVLGLLLPPEETEAASLREGVQLAVEQANACRPGLVRLIIRGREGQWGADAVEAARMVTEDGAQAMIAPPNGAASHLALQIAGRTVVPVVSLCPDSSVSKTGMPWMVRIAPRTVEEARTIYEGIGNTALGVAKHWAAVVPEGRAGRETAKDLKTAAASANCSLENVVEMTSAGGPIQTICQQALRSGPDTILLFVNPKTAGKLMRALRTEGFKGTFAGPGRLNSQALLTSAGNALDGFVIPSAVMDEGSRLVYASFSGAFRKRYSREPDATSALSYDASRLLIRILSENEEGTLPKVFPLTLSLPGASGPLSFDGEGNRKLSLQLLTARAGQFVKESP